MSTQQLITTAGGTQYIPTTCLVDATGATYTASGGGGSTSVEDLLFTDDSNTQFIYRDNGAVPPVFTAYNIPAGTVYTVGSNPRPYAVKSVLIGNTTSVPANIQVASLYYPNSTGNNTVAQLASGATFTGTVETILSLQSAQIEIVCDKAYTLVVNQYIDAGGTQLSGSRTYVKAAGVPTNVNLSLPGNYFNLTVTNNDVATTTTLVVNTTFGIMENVDDAPSSWYSKVTGTVGMLALIAAYICGAGSHVYAYSAGVLVTDTWTLFGTARVKTYGYTSGVLTSESDWV